MKSTLADLDNCGLEHFQFAGMQFPKHVWTLPRGTMRERLKRRQRPTVGDYYHAPKPVVRDHGISFYLDSDGAPGLRWTWADEIDGANIRHNGWYSDEFGDSELIRGIVFRLPHGRGFLAGWSMGEGMITELECVSYSDEVSAAHVADQLAERVAEREREREYQERQRSEENENDE